MVTGEPSPATPMISVKGVNKHFGALHVLKDINLEVPRGQVVVLLGPSGSGKSTLCRTINRLETIDSGSIHIDGELLPEEGRKLATLRSEVGMVFQSFNLFAHKTILENVTLAPMKVRRKNKDEARKEATGAFLDLLYSDAMYEGWYKGTKLLPVTTSMIDKAKAEAATDNDKAFLEALAIVQFLPVSNPQWDALQAALQGSAYQVGTEDPATLLAQIQAQVDAQS